MKRCAPSEDLAMAHPGGEVMRMGKEPDADPALTPEQFMAQDVGGLI